MKAAMLRLVAPIFAHLLVEHFCAENGEIRLSGK